MSELRESLVEFIPQLRDLSSVSERLTKAEMVRLGRIKQSLGEIAKENVKEEMRDSGLRLSNRKGGLLDSVKYDFSSEDWGEIVVDTEYASTLEYGADMKDYMLGKVVPIKTPEGTIFRTVSRTSNNFRNWVIRSYGYFEGAQHKTATSGKTVSIIEDLKEMGLKRVLEADEIGAENLEDVSEIIKQVESGETEDYEEEDLKFILEAIEEVEKVESEEALEAFESYVSLAALETLEVTYIMEAIREVEEVEMIRI